jgi:hypothetical protein
LRQTARPDACMRRKGKRAPSNDPVTPCNISYRKVRCQLELDRPDIPSKRRGELVIERDALERKLAERGKPAAAGPTQPVQWAHAGRFMKNLRARLVRERLVSSDQLAIFDGALKRLMRRREQSGSTTVTVQHYLYDLVAAIDAVPGLATPERITRVILQEMQGAGLAYPDLLPLSITDDPAMPETPTPSMSP